MEIFCGFCLYKIKGLGGSNFKRLILSDGQIYLIPPYLLLQKSLSLHSVVHFILYIWDSKVTAWFRKNLKISGFMAAVRVLHTVKSNF